MSQLYFAFGSNMAATTLLERGVRAQMAGPALLRNHRLAFTLPSTRWTGRAADVLPDESRTVWGVLWNLADRNALDPFELRYDRVEFDVELRTNGDTRIAHRVFGYTVKPELRATNEAPPAPAYLDRMIEGATAAGVPGEYIGFLRSHSSG